MEYFLVTTFALNPTWRLPADTDLVETASNAEVYSIGVFSGVNALTQPTLSAPGTGWHTRCGTLRGGTRTGAQPLLRQPSYLQGQPSAAWAHQEPLMVAARACRQGGAPQLPPRFRAHAVRTLLSPPLAQMCATQEAAISQSDG